MKSKEDVFETLKMILEWYDTNRVFLKMSKEKAIEKTLDNYSDFYEWIYDKGER
jgi:hypothetical protein